MVVPKEVEFMRTVSNTLGALSKLSGANRDRFIDLMLADEGQGLRLLIQLLDTPDAQVSETVNSSLFAMASNCVALETIVKSVVGNTANITTLRWLTYIIAMLTSDSECLNDVYITEESSHPMQAGSTISQEVLCPLATKMIITFHPKSEFEYGTLTLSSDSVTFKFNKENPARTVEIPGSKFKLEYSSVGFSPWGFRLDVTGVFGVQFDIAGSCRAILASGGLTLLTEQSLTSSDAITQRMASRAIANLMFLPEDIYSDSSSEMLGHVIEREGLKISKTDSNPSAAVWAGVKANVISTCLPKILRLADSAETASPMLTTYTRGKKSYSIMYETDNAAVMVGKVLYFEAILQSSECLMIGLTNSTEEFIADSENDTLPDGYYMLDCFRDSVRWGDHSAKISLPSFDEGDCIGILLDMQNFTLQFFVNGTNLGESLSAELHGGSEAWMSGLLPTAFIPTGAGVYWNFGQDSFLYNQPHTSSLLEVLKGPRPQLGFQVRRWQKVEWKCWDTNDGKWRKLDANVDKLVLSDDEVALKKSGLLYNHKRQIARALYGVSFTRIDDAIVDQAIFLSKSPDLSTNRWAILLLLKALENPNKSTAWSKRIIDDSSAVASIVKVCDAGYVKFDNIIETFFTKSSLGFDFSQKYLTEASQLPTANGTIYESSHPYDNNANDVVEIEIPGAASLEISFHPDTKTERTYDFVSFYSVNPLSVDDRDEYRIGDKYSGSFENFPSGKAPLVVPSSKVYLHFVSDSSNTEWGWKLLVRECDGTSTETKEPDLFTIHCEDKGAVIVESPSHPYDNSMDWKHQVEIPGAEAVGIVFDPQTSTENSYDFIRFLHSRDSSEYYGNEKYSGGREGSEKHFPGIGDDEPLIIPANKFCVNFQSDSSNNDWGFRFVAYPCEKPADPWPQFLSNPHIMTFESEHEYGNDMDEHTKIKVDFPNCKAVNIVFDPKCRTERNYDFVVFHKDDTHTTHWGDSMYSGTEESNWPGLLNPIKIDATEFVLSFKTDGSGTDWGYKFYVVPYTPDALTQWAGDFGEIIESAHPYENISYQQKVDFSGVLAIEVAFDGCSTTAGGDFIQFLDSSDITQTVAGAPGQYGGKKGSKNFPSVKNPLLLPVDSFVFAFNNSNSDNSWGYRLAVRPIFELNQDMKQRIAAVSSIRLDPFTEIDQMKRTLALNNDLVSFFLRAAFHASREQKANSPAVSRVVDCPRDDRGFYPSFLDIKESLTFPGAIGLRVEFDDRSETEKDVDVLQFYSNVACNPSCRIPGKMLSGKFSDDWDFSLDNMCQVFYTFESDALQSDWGYRFTISGLYYSVKSPCNLDFLQDPKTFKLLLNRMRSVTTDSWSGLLLANAFSRASARDGLISKHGDQWIKDLIGSCDTNVQLSAVLSFFEYDKRAQSESGLMKMIPDMTKLAEKHNLFECFVHMLTHENTELRAMSTNLLTSCLNIHATTTEGVLLACMDSSIPAVRVMALKEIAKCASDISQAAVLTEMGAVSKLKALLDAGVKKGGEMVAEAMDTLAHLLKYEEAVVEFLDAAGGISGPEVINRFMKSNNTDPGVAILNQVTKVLPNIPPKEFQPPFLPSETGDIEVVKGVSLLGKDVKPTWVAATAVQSITKKKKKIGDDIKKAAVHNEHQISYAFWLCPISVGGDDGVPIFLKGKPNFRITNNEQFNQTIRVDLLAKSGKVYYELTCETNTSIRCGWSSVHAFANIDDIRDFGTDDGTYGVNLSAGQTAQLLWGGFAFDQEHPAVPSCNSGDVIGFLLDFDAGTMQFSVNGVTIPGMTFSALTHGRKPPAHLLQSSGGFIRDTAAAPDWDYGFYPTIRIGPEDKVFVNVGQETFNYRPDNFRSVLETVNRTTAVPPTFSIAKPTGESVWKAAPATLFGDGDDDDDCNIMALSLSPSLRLCFQVGTRTASKKDALVTFCSHAAVAVNTWTHCLIRADEDSIDFVINGEIDSEHPLNDSEVIDNQFPIGLGMSRASFQEDNSGLVWVSNMTFMRFEAVNSEEAKGLMTKSEPVNLSAIRQVESSLSDECIGKVIDDMVEGDFKTNSMAFAIFSRFVNCANDDRLSRLLGPFNGLRVVQRLFALLIDESLSSVDQVEVAYRLAILSGSAMGRAKLIESDALRCLIALSNERTHFWLEIAICNLQIVRGGNDKALEHIGVPVDSCFYFDTSVQPFSQRPQDKAIWREIPIAIYPMMQNAAAFVKIARSIGTPIFDKCVDAITDLPVQYDAKLAQWCVECYSLLTDESTAKRDSATSTVIETKSHPYTSNESYGGTVRLPKAIKILCKFDPQTKCENNYDYLKIWKDSNKSEQIMGPGSEGKFCGTSSENWPSFQVEGSSFYWEWKSDGSGEDWGFKMTATAVQFELPNPQAVRNAIVMCGGTDPLMDFISDNADETLRKPATEALSQLSNLEKVRREVDRRGGLEPLLRKITFQSFVVIAESGVEAHSQLFTSDDVTVVVPRGEEIYVDRRRWFSDDGEADDTHSSAKGHYYLRIAEPKSLANKWIREDSDDVIACEIDKETLRLLGLLALDSKNRSRLIDVGKIKTILKLVAVGDPLCCQAAVMALNEIALSRYEWKKASAAYEVSLRRGEDGQSIEFAASHFLEHLHTSRFSSEFPVHSNFSKASIGYRVCSQGLLGTIISVRSSTSIVVTWDDGTTSTASSFDAILDTKGNIIGYPVREMELLLDDGNKLGSNVEVQMFGQADMIRPALTYAQDRDGSRNKSNIVPIAVSSRNLYMKMVGDLNLLPVDATFRVHVLPKYDAGATIQIGYHESAISFLEKVISASKDEYSDDIKAFAISALGRLVAPIVDKSNRSSSGDSAFKASPLRERFVKSIGLKSILQHLHSNNGKLVRPAWQAMVSFFGDMTQLLEIIPLVMQTPLKDSANLTSLMAHMIFRLTRSRYRPMIDTKQVEPTAVPLNTTVQSNEALTFPFSCYAETSSRSPQEFDISFPGAVGVGMRFHPSSAINAHPRDKSNKGAEERDVLQIYADEERTVLLQSINAEKMRTMVAEDTILYEEGRPALYFTFAHNRKSTESVSVDDKQPDADGSAGTPVVGEYSKPGFALIACADFPHFEHVASIGPTYKRGDGIRENGSGEVKVGCVRFLYCTKLDIKFASGSCSTDTSDVLTFYRDSSCSISSLEKSFSGSSSNWVDFSYEGMVLYYTFVVSSDNTSHNGGFEFTVRPRFDNISDEVAVANVGTFFGQVRDESAQGGADQGLKYLTPLLESRDIDTRRWAAVAYGQLASFGGKLVDPYKGKKAVSVKSSSVGVGKGGSKGTEKGGDKSGGKAAVETVSSSRTQAVLRSSTSKYDSFPAVDKMLDNSGLDFAARMTEDNDPTIRRQGCKALARFLLCRDGRVQIVSGGAWRSLLSVCATAVHSRLSLDIDACRNACWILSQLTKDSDNLEEMAPAFGPLIDCLSSKDRNIKLYAAQAIFSLAEHPANRSELLSSGLKFLVGAATSEVGIGMHGELTYDIKDAIALQQGASKALLDLVVSAVDVADINSALENKAALALQISLRHIVSEVKYVESSSGGSVRLSEISRRKLVLISQALLNLAKFRFNIEEFVNDSLSVWTAIIDEVEKLLTLQVSDEAVANVLSTVRRYLLDAILKFLELDITPLRIRFIKAVILIAARCWKSDGHFIFSTLIVLVSDSEQWVTVIPRNKVVFKDSILNPCEAIFTCGALKRPFEEETSIVVDFLRCFCQYDDIAEPDNQESLLEMLEDSDGVVTTHSPCQFYFRKTAASNPGDEFQLSSTQPQVTKSWRSLKLFYMYELRETTKDFLNSSFNLWSALCAGNNVHAMEYYQSLLSFRQIYSCMMWKFCESNAKLTSQSSVFVTLMKNLYVNTDTWTSRDLSLPASANREVNLIDSGIKRRASPSRNIIITREQQDMLLAYVNEFLGAGRSISDVFGADCPSGFNKVTTLSRVIGDPFESKYILSVLQLLKYMVGYGYYNHCLYDLEVLEGRLIAILAEAAVITTTPAVLEFKLEIVEILEIILQNKLQLQIDEVTDVVLYLFEKRVPPGHVNPAQVDLTCGPEVSEAIYDLAVQNSDPLALAPGVRVVSISTRKPHAGAEGIVVRADSDETVLIWDMNPGKEAVYDTRMLRGIRYPRLRSLLSKKSSRQSNDFEMVMRQVGATLHEGDGALLASTAMRVLALSHNALAIVHSKLDELCMYTKTERSAVRTLQRLKDDLQAVKIDGALGISKQQEIESILNSILYALQARTAGTTLEVGDTVVMGVDWQEEESYEGGVVEERVLVPGGIKAKIKWKEGGESSSHSFGIDDKFEIMRAISGERYVMQSIARIVGIHEAAFGVLQQDSSDGASSEYIGIFRACYAVINSFVKDNSTNKSLVGSIAPYINLMASQLEKPYNAETTLQLVLHTPDTYKNVSPQLMKYFADTIAKKFESSGTVLKVMDLIIGLLPADSRVAELHGDSGSQDDIRQLLSTQQLVLQTLLSAIPEALHFLQNPESAFAVQSFNLKLVSVLAKCIYMNKKLRYDIQQTYNIFAKPDDIMRLFEDIEDMAYGFKSRIHVLLPWIRLLSAWVQDIEEKEKSTGALNIFDSSTMANISRRISIRDEVDEVASDAVDVKKLLQTDLAFYQSAFNSSQGVTAKTNTMVMVESRHPYDDHTDCWVEVEVPGAKRLQVAFSTQCRTESNYDYVHILKAPPRTANNCLVYKTIESQTCHVGSAGTSAVLNNIPSGVVIKVQADGRHRVMDDQADSKDHAGYYYRGRIVEPEQYAETWISLKPSTVQMCDLDGNAWDVKWTEEKFTGSNWAYEDKSLFVFDNKFVIYFHCDGSGNDWGWKLAARALRDDEFPDAQPDNSFDDFKKIPGCRSFESEHPYSNNEDTYEEVVFDGASGINIVFDPTSKTEAHADYVKFYKDGSHDEVWGDDKYHGRGNSSHWAGAGGIPSLYIPADRFVLHFHTDSSETDWGYRFVAFPGPPLPTDFDKACDRKEGASFETVNLDTMMVRSIGTLQVLGEGPVKVYSRLGAPTFDEMTSKLADFPNRFRVVESSHPYAGIESEFRDLFALEGAESLTVRFDPRTTTREVVDILKIGVSDDNLEYEYSGDSDEFPVEYPVHLEASTFAMQFKSEEGGHDRWGYKFVVYDSALENEMPSADETPAIVRADEVVTPLERKEFEGEKYVLVAAGIAIRYEEKAEEESDNDTALLDDPLPSVGESDAEEDDSSTHNPMIEPSDADEEQDEPTAFEERKDSVGDEIRTKLLSESRRPVRLDSGGSNRYSHDQDDTIESQANPMLLVQAAVEEGPTFSPSQKTMWILESQLKLVSPKEEKFTLKCDIIPGSRHNGVAISIQEKSQLGPSDILEFFSSSNMAPSSLVASFDGSSKDCWPTLKSPFLIEGSGNLWAKCSRLSPFTCGVRAVALPAYCPPDVFDKFKLHSLAPGRYKIFESKHPYDNNSDYTFSTRIEGASSLAVFFDPKTSTEQNYDKLTITGVGEFSGGRNESTKNFPLLLEGSSPVMIDGCEFEARFESDSSNDDWGYRMIVLDSILLVPDEVALPEASGDESKRKKAADLFCFFQNRSDQVQTVKLNMPVTKTAYFEVMLSTSSTRDSYVHIGCIGTHVDIVGAATINSGEIQSLPVCHGIGTSKGSYSVDGIDDPLVSSTRWVDGLPKPHSNMNFKAGSIIGVLIDVPNRRISYFNNGQLAGPVIIQDPTISWADGLCPAFTFLPGQSLMVNVGQEEMVHNSEYKSVLSSYLPSDKTGDIKVWDDVFKWKPSAVGDIIFENPKDEAVKNYCQEIVSALRRLGVSDANAMLHDEASSLALENTVIPSRLETLMQYLTNVVRSIKGVVRDVAIERVASMGIQYQDVRDSEDVTQITALRAERGGIWPMQKKAGEVWLRRPDEEIGLSEEARLIDLAAVTAITRSHLDAVFLATIAGRSETAAKTQKDLFGGRLADSTRARAVVPRQTKSRRGTTTIETSSRTRTTTESESRESLFGLEMGSLSEPFLVANGGNEEGAGPTIDNSAFALDSYFINESETHRVNYLRSLVKAALLQEDNDTRSKECTLVIARILRTLGYSVKPGDFDSPDANARKLDEKNKHKYEEKVDTYNTASEKYTLALVQDTLVSVDAVPLACHLLSMTNDSALQQEGVELGIFLLQLVNTKSQAEFMKLHNGNNSEFPTVGVHFMQCIADTLSQFESNVGGRWGFERLKGLVGTDRMLLLLQSLCDGQNTPAQDVVAKTCSKNGETLIGIIVRILGCVYRDINTMGAGAIENNPDELHCLIALAQQVMDTLVDSVQGPHLEIQSTMLSNGIFSILQSLLTVVIELRVAVLRNLSDQKLLPTLEVISLQQSNYIGKALLAQSAKELHESDEWELLEDLNDTERSILELIRSVTELGSYSTVAEATESNIEKYKALLDSFEIEPLIERFRACWASVVFVPTKHIRPYLSKLKRGGYDGTQDKEHANEKKESLAKQAKRIASILRDDTNMSFQPGLVMRSLSEDDKQLFFRMWAMRTKDEVESQVQLAFAHYRNITVICDNLLDEMFMKTCGDETAAKLNEMQEMWDPTVSKSALVSSDEAMGFDSYFASIEVITGRSQLQRIYFPIPPDCREQMKNRLVLNEMDNLVENVKRDSPEKKLDDFLDRSLQVKEVIQHQQYILETSRFKEVFRFVSKYESTFVLITFLLTLYINICLLVNATDDNEKSNDYLTENVLAQVQTAGVAHMILSFILLFNFLMGTALVNINSGFKWKSNVSDGVIALEFLEGLIGGGAEAVFEILSAVLPDFMWAAFFLLTDMKTLYYIAFVLFSVLGVFSSVAYFCFHVLDVVMRISILGYVIKSVTMNIGQVAVTFLLGAVFMWIYSVTAVYNFGYNQYNYGDSPDYTWPASLASTYWQHLDYGLRGPPIFESYDDQATQKYIFDISYQIFIIVIMVAIITGIIIDTFSDLRSNKAEVEDDQQNVCFICGLGREIFERNRCWSVLIAHHIHGDINDICLGLNLPSIWIRSITRGTTCIIICICNRRVRPSSMLWSESCWS